MTEPTKPIKQDKESNLGDFYDHPSYGMIRYGRVSGHATLVGSDLKHQHYMSLEICTSSKNRQFSEDKFYARKQVIQIAMSEHQWASFIASPNTGGVPCTIERRPDPEAEMTRIPKPEEENKHDLAIEELKQNGINSTKVMRKALHSLELLLEGKTVSKVKLREHLAKMSSAVNSVASNMPFYVSQHTEMMEKNIQSAKSEVEGYVSGVVTRLGMESIKDIAPKFIESKNRDENNG